MDAILLPANIRAVRNGIILCVLLTVFFTVLSFFSHRYTAQYMSPSVWFAISRFLFWGYFLALWYHAVKVEKLPVLLWKDQPYGPGFYIASVIVILLSILVLGIVVGLITIRLGGQTRSDVFVVIAKLNVPVKLLGVFTAAIAEELIFRGYLMPRLQVFFKQSWPPIVISSLVFGLGHVGYGTVVNVVMPIVIGLVFAIFYQKYRNIKVLMICHFLIDFNALILAHYK